MDSDRAQLSAMASTLDDLTARITEMAGRYQGSPREDVAQGLYDTERSLRSAGRNLAKVMRLMRG
jgi:hypothetical protein